MKYLCIFLFSLFSIFKSSGQITNVKAGLWSDNTIWNTNSIPVYSDSIVLSFDVTIDINASCKSLNVSGLNVTVNPGIHLSILGNNGVQQLDSGLLAYYPFNSGPTDEGGNGYDLTVNGAIITENRFGTTQKAYRFNGTSDFMTIPAIAKADSLRELTISIWVKAEDLTHSSFISFLPKGTQACSNYLGFDNTSTRYSTWHQMIAELRTSNCTSSIIRDTIANPLNNWTHIILTQRYTTNIYPAYEYNQYYNGKKLKGTGSTYAQPVTPTSLSQGGTIGCDNKSANSLFNFYFFKGDIDDIRIYNRVLSDDEIARLYTLRE